jgi:tetratricopeptide (TPR) repeat protein
MFRVVIVLSVAIAGGPTIAEAQSTDLSSGSVDSRSPNVAGSDSSSSTAAHGPLRILLPTAATVAEAERLALSQSIVLPVAWWTTSTGVEPALRYADRAQSFAPLSDLFNHELIDTRRKLAAAFWLELDGRREQASALVRQAAGKLKDPATDHGVETLGYCLGRQLSLSETAWGDEISLRLMLLALEQRGHNSPFHAAVYYAAAMVEYRAGRYDRALPHIDEAVVRSARANDPAGLADCRSLHCHVLRRLGKFDEAIACARANREKCRQVMGPYSREETRSVLDECEVVLADEGAGKAAPLLDEYAAGRSSGATNGADAYTVVLEIHRARVALLQGKAGRALKLLENAGELAQSLMPHRAAHLRLCRAYVESFRGEDAAARRAYDQALKLAVGRLGDQRDPLRALRKRAAHFPATTEAAGKRSHFDAAGLDQFLKAFADLLPWDGVTTGTVINDHSDLKADPFFVVGLLKAPERAADLRRRLGIEFDEVDPSDVPSHYAALRVKSIVPGTPTSRQDLRSGDLLIEMEQVPTVSLTSAWLQTEKTPNDASFRCLFLRGTEKLERTVSGTATE